MNRTQKLLVGVGLPAVVAVGVVAGVAFAQMPGEDHHGNGASGTDMGQMMDPAAMQDHMKEVLGDEGYQRMRDVMGDHATGIPMDVSDLGGVMAAMKGCLGMEWAKAEATPGAGQHDQHHPTTTP